MVDKKIEKLDPGQLGNIETLDRLGANLTTAIGPERGEGSEDFDELRDNEKAGGSTRFPFDPVIAQNAKMILGMGAHRLSQNRGPHWQLSEEDADKLGVGIAQVIKHYVPDFDNVGVVGNLALISAGIVVPRLMIDVMSKKQQPSDKPKGTTHGQPAH